MRIPLSFCWMKQNILLIGGFIFTSLFFCIRRWKNLMFVKAKWNDTVTVMVKLFYSSTSFQLYLNLHLCLLFYWIHFYFPLVSACKNRGKVEGKVSKRKERKKRKKLVLSSSFGHQTCSALKYWTNYCFFFCPHFLFTFLFYFISNMNLAIVITFLSFLLATSLLI